jgi:xylulokinase
MPNFLGLDIGTTNIKAVLLDSDQGKIISTVSLPTPIHHSGPNQDEHDPQVLFTTIAQCIKRSIGSYPVHALGVSSLAEAGLPLNRSGNPLFPIIAWYDPRSQPQADRILKSFSEKRLFEITGQKVSFSFGLFKYLWIKENYPDRIRDIACWLSVPDYVLYRLTGKKATEYTQASRTMLFDQNKRDWSEELLSYAGLEPSKLPTLLPSGTVMGTITQDASDLTGLPAGMPCVLGGHDHLCGAFASGGIRAGKVIDSSGTACAVMALTSRFNPEKKIAESGFVNYIHVVPDVYVLKGGLKTAGKAVEWLASFIGNDGHFDNNLLLKHYEKNINERPLWLPFFHGSGTPGIEPFNRASLIGLTLEHSREDIVIALFEGLGFWLRENIDTFQKINETQPKEIITIGGVNQNLLMRMIKASITNYPVNSPTVPEASAVGAALLAAVGTGAIASFQEAPEILDYPVQVIYPDPDWVNCYNLIYERVYLSAKTKLTEINKVMHEINYLFGGN